MCPVQNDKGYSSQNEKIITKRVPKKSQIFLVTWPNGPEMNVLSRFLKVLKNLLKCENSFLDYCSWEGERTTGGGLEDANHIASELNCYERPAPATTANLPFLCIYFCSHSLMAIFQLDKFE